MDAICSHCQPDRLLSKHIESFQTMSLLTASFRDGLQCSLSMKSRQAILSLTILGRLLPLQLDSDQITQGLHCQMLSNIVDF